MGEAIGCGNAAAETVFLTFPASLWLVLTGGANKLLMEVTGVKDCGLALLTFDEGVTVLLKVVLGSCVETVPVGLTRTDGKEEFTFAVCGKVNHVVLYLFVEVVVFLLQLLSLPCAESQNS